MVPSIYLAALLESLRAEMLELGGISNFRQVDHVVDFDGVPLPHPHHSRYPIHLYLSSLQIPCRSVVSRLRLSN